MKINHNKQQIWNWKLQISYKNSKSGKNKSGKTFSLILLHSLFLSRPTLSLVTICMRLNLGNITVNLATIQTQERGEKFPPASSQQPAESNNKKKKNNICPCCTFCILYSVCCFVYFLVAVSNLSLSAFDLVIKAK